MSTIQESSADDFFDKLADGIEKAGDNAIKREALIARGFAILYSSGTVTAFQRQLLDYPFAKRHSAPKLPPDIISVGESGGDHFKDHWKIAAPGEEVGPDQISEGQTSLFDSGHTSDGYTVYNDSRVANWLQKGTIKMWSRPVDAKVMQAVEPLADTILSEEMKKLERA